MFDPPADVAPPRDVLTPSSLNRLVRDLLEDALPLIWIEGELSNVARPTSGHVYFTLKDSGAQVRCAMFRSNAARLRFRPADGMHVLARARVGLYEARGEFQLVVEHMEDAGAGALQREFERLKAQLAAEGLFASERKRPIPPLPRRIGVITSATGAAVRDVLHVIARRFPLADVEILPVPVQGKEAPPAIAAMLAAASAAARHDVLLLTRGGGSLEDLWAFNDESVARAIAASTIPVVSAIGHEVDFTIADFVADLRAPTPSAAAELLVPDQLEVQRLLARDHARIGMHFRRVLETRSQRLDQLLARINAQRPGVRLQRARERLHLLGNRLTRCTHAVAERRHARLTLVHARLSACHPAGLVARQRVQSRHLSERLGAAVLRELERRARRLGTVARALNATSPLATLGRGYAILRDVTSGQIVRSVAQAPPGTRLRASVADGEIALRAE